MVNLVELARKLPDPESEKVTFLGGQIITLAKDMANEIERFEVRETELLAAMRNISVLSAAGTYASERDGLAAALKALGHARDIARTAIANARRETP